MENPKVNPDRFARLLAHAEQHLGPVTSGEGPGIYGHNRGFGVGFHLHPEFPMLSAATTGVRFQDIIADLPQEFVVSARPDQQDEAAYLVHVAAEQVIRNGRGYALGRGYVNAEPLIPGTAIEFLLAWTHPHAEDHFDLYRDEHGTPTLQYITLIPATRAEFEHVRAHDDDPGALLELWESREPDLLNIYRQSAA